jgi:hypothetical protein
MEELFIVKVLDIDLFFLWYLIILCIGMAVFAKKSLIKALIPVLVLMLVIQIAVVFIAGAVRGVGV